MSRFIATRPTSTTLHGFALYLLTAASVAAVVG
eukprot:CAMPEP_0174855526 /NCGR_PEP_ID=MMETSP1114-20130205/33474_1 /TAXON_ID=312471 /ORGANISM="Neobodo designis, Strain CCAP 1951/1" /LENGTH=32 /DNA_ID= /DNA_START= /DNA_END= /DNA_ORIENTATION=